MYANKILHRASVIEHVCSSKSLLEPPLQSKLGLNKYSVPQNTENMMVVIAMKANGLLKSRIKAVSGEDKCKRPCFAEPGKVTLGYF